MLCILCIGGDDLNRDGVVATMGSPPYREDAGDPGRARIACLHYEVAESKERSILIERIREYLEDNHSRLQLLSGIRGVQVKDLDIGLLLDDETVSLTDLEWSWFGARLSWAFQLLSQSTKSERDPPKGQRAWP
jgi:hypothetical protein